MLSVPQGSGSYQSGGGLVGAFLLSKHRSMMAGAAAGLLVVGALEWPVETTDAERSESLQTGIGDLVFLKSLRQGYQNTSSWKHALELYDIICR